ncbi:hypothetical protein NSE01_08670 [Novosphingobium sediminis]|uniref:Cell wall hydrolase SleB domain-containing protein n=1 Tax=Novosphingobium sediminis TaxID=707214 RepID=A0A512AH43_9SPHN|nr:cell wall hydrolase [Novosphingobium sediminis]GEN99034.1 hypothetical protein NSE01_08670 [Novosphingobium sediminis]
MIRPPLPLLRSAVLGALLPLAARAEPALILPPPVSPPPAAAAPDPAHEDAMRCLTLAVAYEAGNQPLAGQEAVAEVVLNRLAHPAFPKSVCGVVWQGWRRGAGCQFTFVCDGALLRRLDDRTIRAAQAVAQAALGGDAPRRVAGALNYHAAYVQPAWAATLDPVGRIGAHLFYRPQPGGRAEGAATAGQPVLWEAPDHDLIARVWARYRGVGEGPSAAVLQSEAAPPPRPFAPWGLPVALSCPSAQRRAGGACP